MTREAGLGPPLPLFDSHAHLDDRQFAGDLAAVLERARTAGAAELVSVGCDYGSCLAAVDLAERLPGVYAAVGFHPYDALDYLRRGEPLLRRLARHPRVVAIGEIGLDYHRVIAPPEAQREAFAAQLRLARELGLPVIIHDRDAHVDVLAVLEAETAAGPAGVMHCFSGDWAMAERCLAMGFCIGIGGPITYRKAARLSEVAVRAPLDRLLLETDSPYLAPEPHRGRRNEPAHVALVARRVAELRGMDAAALAAACRENARRLFRL